MPVAIVMSQKGAIPAIIMQDTAAKLVEALAALVEAPVLKDEDAARIWLQGMPAPSGWFKTVEEARAHVKRMHNSVPTMYGDVVKDARKSLGLSCADFAAALGYNGNHNTRGKTMNDIEHGKLNKSSGRPLTLNPHAVERLKALMAEHGLDLATK
ncbi:hypothetical protein [Phaeobacter sp. C3_T13_0]|uniref:hypothetical protein n=1 Tax=Phaeobacter cretensis TaxID=3342641 RepID=UPI0039BC9408